MYNHFNRKRFNKLIVILFNEVLDKMYIKEDINELKSVGISIWNKNAAKPSVQVGTGKPRWSYTFTVYDADANGVIDIIKQALKANSK